MIFGIGTDIVEISRIEKLWRRHGLQFARKVLSEAELAGFSVEDERAYRLLAKRFAAKEALAKAAGSGLREPVTMPKITVTHDGLGKPVFQFDPGLRQYLAQAGVSAHHLSISDEQHHVVAFVVLEQM